MPARTAPPRRTSLAVAGGSREFDPAAAIKAAELAGFVRATLTALPDDYETLLVAKYVNGESVERIAAARIDAGRHPLEARQGKTGLSRTVCENHLRLFLGQRGARAMTNPDHNLNEQRLEELLRRRSIRPRRPTTNSSPGSARNRP